MNTQRTIAIVLALCLGGLCAVSAQGVPRLKAGDYAASGTKLIMTMRSGGVTLYESRGEVKYRIGQGTYTISADNARITIRFTNASGIAKPLSGMTVVYRVNDSESFYSDSGETWVWIRS
jgi:hypothetical protein